MVAATLLVHWLFGAIDLIPGDRPHPREMLPGIQFDYKLVLNAIGIVAFCALMYLTLRRGGTDPVCGMTVDRATALKLTHEGRNVYFCSEHCRHSFEPDPQRYLQGAPADCCSSSGHGGGHH